MVIIGWMVMQQILAFCSFQPRFTTLLVYFLQLKIHIPHKLSLVFMTTGTQRFEICNYGKLLKAADQRVMYFTIKCSKARTIVWNKPHFILVYLGHCISKNRGSGSKGFCKTDENIELLAMA